MTDLDDTDYLLTVNALAKHYGIDRRTVERRLRGIKPARIRRLGGRNFKFYNALEVRELIEAPTDSAALKEAFERLHSVKADIKRVKRAIRTKELMTRADFDEVITPIYLMVRSRVLSLEARLAPLIVNINRSRGSKKKKRAEIAALIEAEIGAIFRIAESVIKDSGHVQ
jgi:hypothetical protein